MHTPQADWSNCLLCTGKVSARPEILEEQTQHRITGCVGLLILSKERLYEIRSPHCRLPAKSTNSSALTARFRTVTHACFAPFGSIGEHVHEDRTTLKLIPNPTCEACRVGTWSRSNGDRKTSSRYACGYRRLHWFSVTVLFAPLTAVS